MGDRRDIRNLLGMTKAIPRKILDDLNKESLVRAFDPVFPGCLTPQIKKVGGQILGFTCFGVPSKTGVFIGTLPPPPNPGPL